MKKVASGTTSGAGVVARLASNSAEVAGGAVSHVRFFASFIRINFVFIYQRVITAAIRLEFPNTQFRIHLCFSTSCISASPQQEAKQAQQQVVPPLWRRNYAV